MNPMTPQLLPPLFAEIIKNDERLRRTRASPVVSFKDFRQQITAKRDYMRAAEQAISREQEN